MMLYNMVDDDEPLHQLEFIDVLERLGVAYHFETEINNILENHYKNIIKVDKLKGSEKDLYATSLEFRLLRQHGFHVSTDVFDRFVDEMGNFKQILSVDIKGVLSLYEASFLSMEDESILEKAREFSIEILKEYVREKNENDEMLMLINHALELPLHWRMPRWEALWFIKAYETTHNMIPSLLHFAKLDFNMVQAIHLEELKQASRWDINCIDNLPDYMKISFLGLFNFVNELAFDILKGRDHHIHSYIRKVWTDYCKAGLKEAKWYYSGYKPSVEEYLENAWVSISAPVMLLHSYFLIPNPMTNRDLELLKEYPHLLRLSSMIFRLADDLGTSKREKEVGDVAKAIECYMNEHKGCEEEEACEHVRSLISKTWKKMNEEAINSGFSQNFKDMCVNLARTAVWCYKEGDGYSDEDLIETNNTISSILFEPIPTTSSSLSLCS
ncbi:myrcene synthase, chloroplastic-like isoform X2 [Senna tora]|uniref:Myrcene synthase, chloroplastic-like isoform X2 n=1 Tax=Senna tora TaxID=362788 RepID=A0A834X217_9FABA|nr:myrcene synthase, chloroplastic-like isoform X2 [Senna tora]